MPNHFETDSVGFDDLLEGSDSSQETSTTEPSNSSAETSVGEELVDNTLTTQEPSSNDTGEGESQTFEGDYMSAFLNEYGISDGKITYENEDGSTEEVNFNDLDDSEKFNVLKQLTTPNLSKEEVDTINYLRTNNATIRDVVDYFSKKAVEDYIAQNGAVEKYYSIDDYSDEELYIADLKTKFEDMSDEELTADLETAKDNEELFKKKVETIRKQYKAREDAEIRAREQEQQDQFNQFKGSIVEQLNAFNDISMDYKDQKADNLEIEDSEKEAVYRYILEQDSNGASQFFKDLNNPERLVKLAWFALYGDEAISNITNYWKSQLKSQRRSEAKAQTTVVKKDSNQAKDNFIKRHHTVETMYGENLL